MPGSPRQYNLCKELSKNNEIELVFFTPDEEREKELKTFEEAKTVFAKTYRYTNTNSSKKTSWIAKQQHRLMAEPSFSFRFKKPEEMLLRKEYIEKIVKDSNPDLLLIDGIQNWQFISVDLDTIPRVIDFCDCITGLLVQQAKAAPSFKIKIALYLEAYGVMQTEKKALKECDLSVAISKKDEHTLKTIYKEANTLIVPNGVDPEFFKCKEKRAVNSNKKIIFTGVMGYEPNKDAVMFFAKEILPLVNKKHPDAEFWVVGARPPKEITKLGEHPNITVTGSVDDIRPYLEQASIFACPLRLGAGVKNKILSAWAMELPLVATSLSMSGLKAENKQHYLLADDPVSFSDAISKIIEDNNLAKALGENSRALVINNFSWQSANKTFENELNSIIK